MKLEASATPTATREDKKKGKRERTEERLPGSVVGTEQK